MWGHMGFASAVRISIADGYAEEPLYEDDLNARLEEDPDADYIYPGDVIPGSVYLTMCRGGLTLPLTHYDEIRRILEGEKPAVTEGQYPNRDPAFFENLINGSGEVYAVTADGFTNSPGRIAVPADLNADGQLEYWIAASDGSSEVRIILHEQDGIVYAYLLNYTDGYELDADGNIVCSSPYYSFRFRLIFDREQAFLLSLPD